MDVEEINLGNFDVMDTINKGAYGRVYLMERKSDKQLYAMKVMYKKELVNKNKQLQNEVKIMASNRSGFIVDIFYVIQNERKVYLLMEYMNGGDLRSLIDFFGPLSYEVARFYVAEVVLALEYLHKNKVIHRDLKPDNILVTSSGHIKLTDFGLSEVAVRDIKVSDVVQTPNSHRSKRIQRTPRQIMSLLDVNDYKRKKTNLHKVVEEEESGQTETPKFEMTCKDEEKEEEEIKENFEPENTTLKRSLRASKKRKLNANGSLTTPTRSAANTGLSMNFIRSLNFHSPEPMNSTPMKSEEKQKEINRRLMRKRTESSSSNYSENQSSLSSMNVSPQADRLVMDRIDHNHNILNLTPEISMELGKPQIPGKRRRYSSIRIPDHVMSFESTTTHVSEGDERQNETAHEHHPAFAALMTVEERSESPGVLQQGLISSQLQKEGLFSPELQNEEEASASPELHEKSSPLPELQREPSTSPELQREPSTSPELEREPSTSPEVQREPSTSPEVQREPSTSPEVQSEPPTSPEVQSEPPTSPEVQREPSTSPEVQIEEELAPAEHENDLNILPLQKNKSRNKFLSQSFSCGAVRSKSKEMGHSESFRISPEPVDYKTETPNLNKTVCNVSRIPLRSFIKKCEEDTDEGLEDDDKDVSIKTFTSYHMELRNSFKAKYLHSKSHKSPLHSASIGKTSRLMGTPDYLAPELLRTEPHDSAVDWWALGICFYQFLTAMTPFNADTVEEIFKKILNHDMTWHNDSENQPIKDEYKDLILSLLDSSPKDRANSQDIRKSPIFSSMSWSTDLRDEEPPFVPQPDNSTDTGYFNKREQFFFSP